VLSKQGSKMAAMVKKQGKSRKRTAIVVEEESEEESESEEDADSSTDEEVVITKPSKKKRAALVVQSHLYQVTGNDEPNLVHEDPEKPTDSNRGRCVCHGSTRDAAGNLDEIMVDLHG
jgi:hypothetical protein